jgi:hypothetical protein
LIGHVVVYICCFAAVGLLALHVGALAVVGRDLYLPCLLELVVDILLFYELFLLDCSDQKWLLFRLLLAL